MRYAIQIEPSFARGFDRLPANLQRRVNVRVALLADSPRPPGCAKLSGFPSRYRIRVGDYRVIYEVKDELLTVLVVRVGHRREVYR